MKRDFLLFFIFASLLFLGSSVLTQAAPKIEEEPICIPGPFESYTYVSDPFRCQNFAVYKCTNNNCGTDGGAIDKGVMWYMCVTTITSWTNGCESGQQSRTDRVSGPHGPDQIMTAFKKVPDYRICPANYNSWSPTYPNLQCSGACYPAPTQKSLNDSSLNPENVSDNTGYKLPVNFGWEDLEEIVGEADSYCPVGSYEFNIVNPSITKNVSRTQLQDPNGSQYELQCQLDTGTNYQWKTRGCLTIGDCGDWSSSQSFKTSLAPELYSPYDPDWNDENFGLISQEEISDLNWCEISNSNFYQETSSQGEEYYKPLSYRIKLKQEEDCHEALTSLEDCSLLLKPEIIPVPKVFPPESFSKGEMYFTKKSNYSWSVAACKDKEGSDCTEYSQEWSFNTSEWDINAYIVSPPDNKTTPVGFPVLLQWNSNGGGSYKYEIKGIESGTTTVNSLILGINKLNLNKTYEWRIQACYDTEAKDCEDAWGGPWFFKTTGRSPSLNNIQDYSIPVELSWENVPGGKSYVLHLVGPDIDKTFLTEKNSSLIYFPNLKQNTSYSWQVKTCAEENGKTCGEYSQTKSFTTSKIAPPTNFSPFDNENLLIGQKTKIISWEKVLGAQAYQYELSFYSPSSEETKANCINKTIITPTTTKKTSSDLLDLNCLGEYQWRVRSCIEENCQDAGDWSPWISFSLSSGDNVSTGGLVPCGRNEDNPKTSWDETEKCGIKHIFLLIRNVVDFILWTFAPIMLGILVLATGLVMYFSIKFQISSLLVKIKTIWKSAGLGYGILFLSWTALNLFLRLIGFDFGVFGEWWKF